MTSRIMYAPRGWETDGEDVEAWFLRGTPYGQHTPVLVTDATGMPPLEPGDLVQTMTSKEGVVIGHPFPFEDGWVVPVDHGGRFVCWWSNGLTKLTRETSVLLRVTGPEEAVRDTTMHLKARQHDRGVRVVRVERVQE